jgi:hypothetical protein
MTPYELRFKIFEQAQALAESEYQAEYSIVSLWNENPHNTVKMAYPEFPSYEKIEVLANKINTFVSSK